MRRGPRHHPVSVVSGSGPIPADECRRYKTPVTNERCSSRTALGTAAGRTRVAGSETYSVHQGQHRSGVMNLFSEKIRSPDGSVRPLLALKSETHQTPVGISSVNDGDERGSV